MINRYGTPYRRFTANNLKQYFAYTRVSTTRQGEQGVSLQQQRVSIEQFSARTGLTVFEWLEEQETAAKSGRPVFTQMLKRVKIGRSNRRHHTQD